MSEKLVRSFTTCPLTFRLANISSLYCADLMTYLETATITELEKSSVCNTYSGLWLKATTGTGHHLAAYLQRIEETTKQQCK